MSLKIGFRTPKVRFPISALVSLMSKFGSPIWEGYIGRGSLASEVGGSTSVVVFAIISSTPILLFSLV